MTAPAFTTLKSLAAPLRHTDVDTDVIIRIDRLTANTRETLGPFLMEALRTRADGSPDPEFILNRAPWQTAAILIAGRNFGCGSSREAAVWALVGAGIRCIIAPSFGDIFFDNCFQNGLLPICIEDSILKKLFEYAEAERQFSVSLPKKQIIVAGESLRFQIDDWRREVLLQGLDQIDFTLSMQAEIKSWQHKDRQRRSWVWSIQRWP